MKCMMESLQTTVPTICVARIWLDCSLCSLPVKSSHTRNRGCEKRVKFWRGWDWKTSRRASEGKRGRDSKGCEREREKKREGKQREFIPFTPSLLPEIRVVWNLNYSYSYLSRIWPWMKNNSLSLSLSFSLFLSLLLSFLSTHLHPHPVSNFFLPSYWLGDVWRK